MSFATIVRPNHVAGNSASATNHRKAGASLWVLQGLLAATFLMAGISKLVMSSADLTADTDLTASFLRFVGVCETLGAVGLILPGLLKIRTGLTPLAAACLAIIMVGATTVTIAAGDAGVAVVPAAVGVLCAVVCWSRARKVALRGGSRRDDGDGVSAATIPNAA